MFRSCLLTSWKEGFPFVFSKWDFGRSNPIGIWEFKESCPHTQIVFETNKYGCGSLLLMFSYLPLVTLLPKGNNNKLTIQRQILPTFLQTKGAGRRPLWLCWHFLVLDFSFFTFIKSFDCRKKKNRALLGWDSCRILSWRWQEFLNFFLHTEHYI